MADAQRTASPHVPQRYTLRKPCVKCGEVNGRIETKNGQDCVYCCCGAYQYCAPKVETGREVRSVQTVHGGIKPKQRARVLMRSNARCEMCGKSSSNTNLHVGHILDVKNGLAAGLTEIQLNDDENLVAMCEECNLGLGAEALPLRFVVRVLMQRLAVGRAEVASNGG